MRRKPLLTVVGIGLVLVVAVVVRNPAGNLLQAIVGGDPTGGCPYNIQWSMMNPCRGYIDECHPEEDAIYGEDDPDFDTTQCYKKCGLVFVDPAIGGRLPDDTPCELDGREGTCSWPSFLPSISTPTTEGGEVRGFTECLPNTYGCKPGATPPVICGLIAQAEITDFILGGGIPYTDLATCEEKCGSDMKDIPKTDIPLDSIDMESILHGDGGFLFGTEGDTGFDVDCPHDIEWMPGFCIGFIPACYRNDDFEKVDAHVASCYEECGLRAEEGFQGGFQPEGSPCKFAMFQGKCIKAVCMPFVHCCAPEAPEPQLCSFIRADECVAGMNVEDLIMMEDSGITEDAAMDVVDEGKSKQDARIFFNESSCRVGCPYCGNGMIEGSEECDPDKDPRRYPESCDNDCRLLCKHEGGYDLKENTYKLVDSCEKSGGSWNWESCR
ncbi:MAG: hypothetical protein ABIA92_01750, partial [Patescibacteria group bacterium]